MGSEKQGVKPPEKAPGRGVIGGENGWEDLRPPVCSAGGLSGSVACCWSHSAASVADMRASPSSWSKERKAQIQTVVS